MPEVPQQQDDLLEPLLRRKVSGEESLGPCPPSFKRSRPRKTPDFISSERAAREKWSMPGLEHPEDIDPRLVSDADAKEIFAKVASLVWGHIEEGNRNAAMAAGHEDDPEYDEFHEVHFLRPRLRCCGCWRRPTKQRVSEENICLLLTELAQSLYFCKQVLLLCAVYIEQLLRETCVMITDGNWRTLLVAGLLIASKVWEDVHPWNADFEACLLDVTGMRYFPGALYKLESLFLKKLGWRVFVNGEVYANYYFALLENRSPLDPSIGTCSKPAGFRKRPSRPRLNTEPCGMDPILEDELFADKRNDHDLERGLSTLNEMSCGSLASIQTEPWSPTKLQRKSEWVADLRKSTLDGGDSNTLTSSALRDGWRLDANNPYIGALRHAPPVLAPSRYIQQSEQLLWAHSLATRTAEVLGPPSFRSSWEQNSATLSGATGSQLASELQRYMKGGGISQASDGNSTTEGTGKATTADLFG